MHLLRKQPGAKQVSFISLYPILLVLSISLWLFVSISSSIEPRNHIRITVEDPSRTYTTPEPPTTIKMSSNSYTNDSDQADNQNNQLYGFYYRVHGQVQGVYFRKYTQQKASQLGLSGWIRNDKTNGTVEGQVICVSSDCMQLCNQMKVWLQSEGSPMSQIDYADFQTMSSPEEIQALWKELVERNGGSSLPAFEVRKTLNHRK